MLGGVGGWRRGTGGDGGRRLSHGFLASVLREISAMVADPSGPMLMSQRSESLRKCITFVAPWDCSFTNVQPYGRFGICSR